MQIRAGFVAIGLLALSLTSVDARSEDSHLATETPIWANDFVDSIGENTHCSFAHIGWVDCRNPSGAAAAIKTLGIRHLRDTVSDYWNGYKDSGGPHIPTYIQNGTSQPITAFYNELGDNNHVKYDFIIGLHYGNHAPYVNAITTAVPSTESFELGGNEPDSPYQPDPCPSPNPSGLSCWPRDTMSQIEYYANPVKAAGRLRIGPSIEFGSDYTCTSVPGAQRVVLSSAECPNSGAPNVSVLPNVGSYVDADNLHHYAAERHPGNAVLATYRAKVQQVSTPVNTWVTEAGYGTGKNGNDNERIAEYEPRIFAEYASEGIARTYQFEMFDQTRAAAGPYFDTFGLLSVDWSTLTFTPKPQYEALRSLIQIMNDPSTRPTLTPLSYRIAGGNPQVHHLLAQRADGTYQLLLWVEAPDPAPTVSVNVLICSPGLNVGYASQFTPKSGQYINTRLVAKQNGKCNAYGPLNVTGALQIDRFGKAAFTPVQPLPRATPFTAELKP